MPKTTDKEQRAGWPLARNTLDYRYDIQVAAVMDHLRTDFRRPERTGTVSTDEFCWKPRAKEEPSHVQTNRP